MNPEVLLALEKVRVSADLMGFSIAETSVTVDDPRRLESALAKSIYRMFHAGLRTDSENRPRHRDPDLERDLATAVPHESTPASVRLLERRANRDLVELDGLKVLVEAQPERTNTGLMELPSVRPALSPGFLLVDGSRGSLSGMPLTRLYFHVLAPESAPSVWGTLLRSLEDLSVPYRAKAASGIASYPRYDAVVVYLGKSEWSIAKEVVDSISEVAGMGAATSIFGFKVAPGVSVASEPNTDGRRMVSFGQHRAAAAAKGIVASVERSENLAQSLREAFTDAGINPEFPAFNADEGGEKGHWSYAWM